MVLCYYMTKFRVIGVFAAGGGAYSRLAQGWRRASASPSQS